MNVFKYQDIIINDIQLFKYPNNIFLKYKDSKIRFITPVMTTEGISKKYNVIYLNLEFGAMDASESLWEFNPIENKDLIDFYNFINNFDYKIETFIKKSEPYKQFVSSIKNERNRVLRVRVPMIRNSIDCEFFDSTGKRIPSFDIKPNDNVSCVIEVTNVWTYKNSYGVTLSAKKVVVLS